MARQVDHGCSQGDIATQLERGAEREAEREAERVHDLGRLLINAGDFGIDWMCGRGGVDA